MRLNFIKLYKISIRKNVGYKERFSRELKITVNASALVALPRPEGIVQISHDNPVTYCQYHGTPSSGRDTAAVGEGDGFEIPFQPGYDSEFSKLVSV